MLPQHGGYFIDAKNTSTYIFINPKGEADEIQEIIKYKKKLQKQNILVNEDDFDVVYDFITAEVDDENFCVPDVNDSYVYSQLRQDCCIIAVADKDLIVDNKIVSNKHIYSFALLQLRLSPKRKVYIDIFCSYKANEPDNAIRPEGGGSIVVNEVKKMAVTMKFPIVYLSSVVKQQNWYAKRGFRHILTDKTDSTKKIKVSLKNKTKRKKRKLLDQYSKIEEENGELVVMGRIVPTPENSPLLNLNSPQKPTSLIQTRSMTRKRKNAPSNSSRSNSSRSASPVSIVRTIPPKRRRLQRPTIPPPPPSTIQAIPKKPASRPASTGPFASIGNMIRSIIYGRTY